MEKLIPLHSQQLLIVEGSQGLVAVTKASRKGVPYVIPVIVLPRGHPSLKRFPLLLAVGRKVKLTSRIQSGVEPTAGLLCAPSKEFDGLLFLAPKTR